MISQSQTDNLFQVFQILNGSGLATQLVGFDVVFKTPDKFVSDVF